LDGIYAALQPRAISTIQKLVCQARSTGQATLSMAGKQPTSPLAIIAAMVVIAMASVTALWFPT
jgi:hypothetical protein